jgi:hypothetical protein
LRLAGARFLVALRLAGARFLVALRLAGARFLVDRRLGALFERFAALLVVRLAPARRAAGFLAGALRVERFRTVRLAGMVSPSLAIRANAADPAT